MWRLLTGCQEQKLTQGSCPHTHPSVFATQHPLISAKMSKTKFNNSHAILDLIKKKKSCIFCGIMSPQTKRFVFAYIHHNERTMLKERKGPVLLLLLLFSPHGQPTYFGEKTPLSDTDRFLSCGSRGGKRKSSLVGHARLLLKGQRLRWC